MHASLIKIYKSSKRSLKRTLTTTRKYIWSSVYHKLNRFSYQETEPFWLWLLIQKVRPSPIEKSVYSCRYHLLNWWPRCKIGDWIGRLSLRTLLLLLLCCQNGQQQSWCNKSTMGLSFYELFGKTSTYYVDILRRRNLKIIQKIRRRKIFYVDVKYSTST